MGTVKSPKAPLSPRDVLQGPKTARPHVSSGMCPPLPAAPSCWLSRGSAEGTTRCSCWAGTSLFLGKLRVSEPEALGCPEARLEGKVCPSTAGPVLFASGFWL